MISCLVCHTINQLHNVLHKTLRVDHHWNKSKEYTRLKKRKKKYVYLDYSLSLQYSARCVRRAWYIWKLDKPIRRNFSVTRSFTLRVTEKLSHWFVKISDIYIYPFSKTLQIWKHALNINPFSFLIKRDTIGLYVYFFVCWFAFFPKLCW